METVTTYAHHTCPTCGAEPMQRCPDVIGGAHASRVRASKENT